MPKDSVLKIKIQNSTTVLPAKQKILLREKMKLKWNQKVMSFFTLFFQVGEKWRYLKQFFDFFSIFWHFLYVLSGRVLDVQVHIKSKIAAKTQPLLLLEWCTLQQSSLRHEKLQMWQKVFVATNTIHSFGIYYFTSNLKMYYASSVNNVTYAREGSEWCENSKVLIRSWCLKLFFKLCCLSIRMTLMYET